MNLPYAVPPKQMPEIVSESSYRDVINLVQLEVLYVQCSSQAIVSNALCLTRGEKSHF